MTLSALRFPLARMPADLAIVGMRELLLVRSSAPHNALGRTKTFLGLVKAIRQWTTAQGATHAQIHATTGTNLEATDQLLKAAGAKCVGGSYVV